MKLRESPVVFDQEKHTYRLEDILLEGDNYPPTQSAFPEQV